MWKFLSEIERGAYKIAISHRYFSRFVTNVVINRYRHFSAKSWLSTSSLLKRKFTNRWNSMYVPRLKFKINIMVSITFLIKMFANELWKYRQAFMGTKNAYVCRIRPLAGHPCFRVSEIEPTLEMAKFIFVRSSYEEIISPFSSRLISI